MGLELYAGLAVLIALSGLFSGSEIAMFSLSSIKVRKLVRQKRKGAKTLRKLKSDPHRLLVTILICNNVVNIAAASLATLVAVETLGSLGVGVSTGIVTFLILVFGEITPKSFFHQKNERMSLLMAGPIRALGIALYPVSALVGSLSRGLLMLGNVRRRKHQITEDEIMAALALGTEAGIIEKGEHEMMKNVIEFGDMRVRDVMTPSKRMASLSSDQKLIEGITKMLETRYSRIPVYAHGTGNIMGVIHLKDLLKHVKAMEFEIPLVQLVSPVTTMKSDERLDTAFGKLRESATHMAIVKEKGRAVGLVTMEDLLEEIVGEIYDEADRKRFRVHFLDKKTAVVRGDTTAEEARKWTGIPLKSGSESLSRLVSDRFSGRPKAGQRVKMKNYVITVLEVSRKDPSRVKRLKIAKRRGKIRG